MFSVGIYIVFSAILNILTGIDICVPCLFKSLFGFNCPGCGLTTAFISLVELDFKKAFDVNWLIFIVVPFGLFYLSQDYVKHKRKYNA
jgi:hypothetical protein